MQSLHSTTLIVLAARSGDPVPAARAPIPDIDRVIAADSGLHLALALGLYVDVVIGDFDSVDPGLVARAREQGTSIQVHPRDKDHTDLALALELAAEDGPDRILVVGGAGGRLDHGMANLLCLADDRWADCQVRAHLGGAAVAVVRATPVELTGEVGSLVSLLPVGGPATLTTAGLKWDLDREVLAATSSRGVSNELRTTTARVAADEGVALAIQPAPDEALET